MPLDTERPAAPASRFRSLLLNLVALAFGVVVSLLLLEFLLTIHNPFQARIKGNRIVLLTNKQYHIKNDVIPALDPEITVTRNSLGFRGSNPPPNFGDYLTFFTVGGSTTQCFFLSDDKTWTARFGHRLEHSFRNVWFNNAGLDGHSTFGHLVLLEDHIRNLHPKLVLFLIGVNDLDRDPYQEWDAENVKGRLLFQSPTAFMKSLSAYSEVASLIANLFRSLNAYKRGLLHQRIDLKALPYLDIPPADADRNLASHNPAFLQGFEERVKRLVADCRASNIEPVLITQPVLAGSGIDDVTKVDLARIYIGPQNNGSTWWRLLEQYNDVTRRIGREQNVMVVDVGRRLPKSSRNFYDLVHYTNEGAQAIADILYQDLCPSLATKFPQYANGSCTP